MSEILQPGGWKRASGYSHGIKASGEMIFVAGQIGCDSKRNVVSDDLAEQTQRALENVLRVLIEADAEPRHIVRLTWYVTDIDEYHASTKAVGEAYRAVMGAHFPAMSLFEVARLVDPRAKVEIEATAVVSTAD